MQSDGLLSLLCERSLRLGSILGKDAVIAHALEHAAWLYAVCDRVPAADLRLPAVVRRGIDPETAASLGPRFDKDRMVPRRLRCAPFLPAHDHRRGLRARQACARFQAPGIAVPP